MQSFILYNCLSAVYSDSYVYSNYFLLAGASCDIMIDAGGSYVFEFSVKFYPPEPTILQEEITRSVL